ncbi:hypothetical protein EW146_g1617 [Bondarzewia mesenterica]|uniref:Possible tRNA binding domain-containing protein n=1 Tax=Bondarzewia mesenterica TaxID=1095465 RepID=A0A4S4M3B5_9AGAM|nr:hypothetical protein EW146_g1617 [Bondarzewia mesenterica]
MGLSVLEAVNAGVKYLDASPGLEFLDHYFLDPPLFASFPVELASTELSFLMTPFDLKRLESYAQNTLDYHVVLDLLPTVVSLYFEKRLDIQQAVISASIRDAFAQPVIAGSRVGGESLQVSAEQGLKSMEAALDEAGGEVTNALREKQRAMIDALNLSRLVQHRSADAEQSVNAKGRSTVVSVKSVVAGSKREVDGAAGEGGEGDEKKR